MSRQWQLVYKIPPSFAVVGNSILFGVSRRHHVCLGTFLYAKSSKKVHFLHSNGPPLNQPKGSDNCLGSLKNIRLGSLKKNRFAPPTHHHHPCISCCGAHPPPLYQSPPHPPPPNKVIKVSSQSPPHPPPPNKVIKVSSQYCTTSNCTTIEHTSVYDMGACKIPRKFIMFFLVHVLM